MGERLKQLRKHLGMTQQEFAEELGVARGNISNYELDRFKLSSSAISLICNKFNVNREWLETGKGEMFGDVGKLEDVASLVNDILKDTELKIKEQLITALARLGRNEWLALEKIADNLCKLREKEKEKDGQD